MEMWSPTSFSADSSFPLLFQHDIPPITDLLKQGNTPEDLLAMIFEGVPYHLLGKRDLSYRCTCSRERVEKALISLGSDELQKLIAEEGEAEITCEYCRSRYHFTKNELKNLQEETVRPSEVAE